jgi:hypothetical protein
VIEKLVSLNVERSYEELRRILLANECKIIAEDPPRSITVKHGSFWAWTPRDVKKKVRFILIPQDSNTKITAITSLASDYIALSILTFILMITIIPVGVWIVIDVENWVMEERSTFWGWLAENLLGFTGYKKMLMLISIAKILLAITAILLLVSLISDIYIYVKRESFSEEILKMLT